MDGYCFTDLLQLISWEKFKYSRVCAWEYNHRSSYLDLHRSKFSANKLVKYCHKRYQKLKRLSVPFKQRPQDPQQNPSRRNNDPPRRAPPRTRSTATTNYRTSSRPSTLHCSGTSALNYTNFPNLLNLSINFNLINFQRLLS